MVNNLLQLVGFGLVLAWCWLVWPPLPLLVGGVLLVAWAELRRLREVHTTPPAGGESS